MRLKAKLAPEQVSLLYSLTVPLSRLSSSSTEQGTAASDHQSVLILDKTHVRISCKGTTNDTDGIACFAEMKAEGGIFLELRIESPADNQLIMLGVDLVQIRLALQSICGNPSDRNNTSSQTGSSQAMLDSQQYHYTILKLAKQNNLPVLSLDTYTQGAGVSSRVQVHHAIPVRLLRPADLPHYLPPNMPSPDVQLEFAPHQLPLRTVMDRVKGLSPTVLIQASSRGQVTVSVDTDGASIRTVFSHLTPIQSSSSSSGGPTTPTPSTTVKVQAKKVLASFAWQQQPTGFVSSALLCLQENESLVVHVVLVQGIGFFTYYVPVHYMSPEEANQEASADY